MISIIKSRGEMSSIRFERGLRQRNEQKHPSRRQKKKWYPEILENLRW